MISVFPWPDGLLVRTLAAALCCGLMADSFVVPMRINAAALSVQRSVVHDSRYKYDALVAAPLWQRRMLYRQESIPAAYAWRRHAARLLAMTIPFGVGIVGLLKSAWMTTEPVVTATTAWAVKTTTIPLEITVRAGDGPIRIARRVLGDGTRWKELFDYFPEWGTPEHFVLHPGVAHGVLTVPPPLPPAIVMHSLPLNAIERLIVHPPELLWPALGAAIVTGVILLIARHWGAAPSRRLRRWAVAGLLSVGFFGGGSPPPALPIFPSVVSSSKPAPAPLDNRQKKQTNRRAPRPFQAPLSSPKDPSPMLSVVDVPEMPAEFQAINSNSFAWPAGFPIAMMPLPAPITTPAANPATAQIMPSEGLDIDQDPEEGPESQGTAVHWFEALPGDHEVRLETNSARETRGGETTLETGFAVANADPSSGPGVGDAISGPSMEAQVSVAHHSNGQLFSKVLQLGGAADLKGMHEAQALVGLSAEKTDKKKSKFLKWVAGFVLAEEEGKIAAGPGASLDSGTRLGHRAAFTASAGIAPRTGPFVKATLQIRVHEGPKFGMVLFGRFALGESVLVHLHIGPAIGVRLMFPQPRLFRKKSADRRHVVLVISFSGKAIPNVGVGFEPRGKEPPQKETKQALKGVHSSLPLGAAA